MVRYISSKFRPVLAEILCLCLCSCPLSCRHPIHSLERYSFLPAILMTLPELTSHKDYARLSLVG